jgi:hypothetical protein
VPDRARTYGAVGVRPARDTSRRSRPKS